MPKYWKMRIQVGRSGSKIERNEQPNSRVLLVQYQGVEGNAIDQFKLPGKQVIIFPPELRSGEFRYPFSDIKR